MSRGLGRLQLEILESISSPNPIEEWTEAYKRRFRLMEPACDLRAVLRETAKMHNAYSYGCVKSTYQASFSRAVRGLLRRGLLKRLWLVPVAEIDKYSRRESFERLSDGTYLMVPERQVRFVIPTCSSEAAS